MNINIGNYLDGGSTLININGNEFCFDNRIKTETRGKIYNGYPENDNSNIYPNQIEVREILSKNIQQLEDYLNELRELNKFIEYKGYKYYYEYRTAKHKKDICLATTDPEKYCNGFYLYSDKDSGNNKAFVVIDTDQPDSSWYEN